jgi:uncharacterized protein (TIGR02266 family)
MSEQSGAERRQTVRYHARFDVRFSRVADAARAMRAFSLNLSLGGLALQTTQTYAVGDELNLSLTIDRVQLEVDGVVAWVRGGAIGVRFANLSAEARHHIEAVLATRRALPT